MIKSTTTIGCAFLINKNKCRKNLSNIPNLLSTFCIYTNIDQLYLIFFFNFKFHISF